MKRFPSILAAVSVLPAVAAIAALVLGLLGIKTSFWVPVVGISVIAKSHAPCGESTIMLVWVSGDPIPGSPPDEPPYSWDHAGIRYTRSYVMPGGGLWQYQPCTMIVFRTWLPALLFVPPLAFYYAIRFHRWWRARRRQMAGKCPNCGYDLRATPERCPECGEVPCRKSAGVIGLP